MQTCSGRKIIITGLKESEYFKIVIRLIKEQNVYNDISQAIPHSMHCKFKTTWFQQRDNS